MLTGMLTYLHIANTMTNNQQIRCSGSGLAGNRASCVEDTWLTASAAKSSDHKGVNCSTLVQKTSLNILYCPLWMIARDYLRESRA